MTLRLLAVALLSLVLVQAGLSSAATAAAGQTTAKTSKVTAKAKAAAKPARKAAVRKMTVKIRKSSKKRAATHVAADTGVLQLDRDGNPLLRSSAFVVVSQTTGDVILERKSESVLPIASITKLMTAMVVLDAGQSLSEEIVVSEADIDTLKGTGSRLSLGTRLRREEMLHLALMSSENRAASALARHYPGGEAAFVAAMNVKAKMIGLWDTRFSDSTGLDPANVSSPRDLVKMVSAASTYPLIREFSTTSERYVEIRGRMHRFGNTNSLVRKDDWQIGISKTGYIREAGRCLVMQAWLLDQPVIIVLMDSEGRYTRTADAVRIKKWLESAGLQRLAALSGRKG
jgi:D-alanyl-D-alanine endopeptidase (penicillin-binding protein 7)